MDFRDQWNGKEHFNERNEIYLRVGRSGLGQTSSESLI